MKQFRIYGMNCAACSARVENSVSKLSGVKTCAVNLLTNSMTVSGNVTEEVIINAVKKAGYGAELLTDNSKDVKSRYSFKKLVLSAVLLLILMYFSMGYMMWGFPLPIFLKNPIIIGIIEFIITTAIIIINNSFFISGFKAIKIFSPNMDTLIALGCASAYIYSVVSLIIAIRLQLSGNTSVVFHRIHALYFESAGMILTLITVGKMLEEFSKGKATNAINSLKNLAPETVNLLIDGKEIKEFAKNVKIGDLFIVRTGEGIPADGIITDGTTTVNESAITGESIPVSKTVNDKIYAGTFNVNGTVICKVTAANAENTISRIIDMVTTAASDKAPIARIADKVSSFFVPIVIFLAFVTATVWFVLTKNISISLKYGISVLVISCPCALGLATPVAIMVANGVGAKHGILFKNATSLETLGKVKNIIFDKTGTVTYGKPVVTDIINFNDFNKEFLIKIAYSVENGSGHPLASAVKEYCENNDIELLKCTEFNEVIGKGISAKFDGKTVFSGNLNFISENSHINKDVVDTVVSLSNQGKTPLIFAFDESVAGIIAVTDEIKPDAKQSIQRLNGMHINTVMLTGDNKNTANSVARQIGIKNTLSELLPQDKMDAVNSYKEKGITVMVGDGINDAPALTAADVGMAIGAGTDIAIDSADVVLVKNDLLDVVNAVELSKKTLLNIKENLFWAFIYNIIGIPVAAGVFVHINGLQLNPMFAAAAMSFSSVCVVTNALRLNFFKGNKIVKKITKEDRKEKTMKKTIKIDGMMCTHCSGMVKSELEALEQVSTADVSHETGLAVVTLNSDIDSDILVSVIEKSGYKVIEIE